MAWITPESGFPFREVPELRTKSSDEITALFSAALVPWTVESGATAKVIVFSRNGIPLAVHVESNDPPLLLSFVSSQSGFSVCGVRCRSIQESLSFHDREKLCQTVSPYLWLRFEKEVPTLDFIYYELLQFFEENGMPVLISYPPNGTKHNCILVEFENPAQSIDALSFISEMGAMIVKDFHIQLMPCTLSEAAAMFRPRPAASSSASSSAKPYILPADASASTPVASSSSPPRPSRLPKPQPAPLAPVVAPQQPLATGRVQDSVRKFSVAAPPSPISPDAPEEESLSAHLYNGKEYDKQTLYIRLRRDVAADKELTEEYLADTCKRFKQFITDISVRPGLRESDGEIAKIFFSNERAAAECRQFLYRYAFQWIYVNFDQMRYYASPPIASSSAASASSAPPPPSSSPFKFTFAKSDFRQLSLDQKKAAEESAKELVIHEAHKKQLDEDAALALRISKAPEPDRTQRKNVQCGACYEEFAAVMMDGIWTGNDGLFCRREHFYCQGCLHRALNANMSENKFNIQCHSCPATELNVTAVYACIQDKEFVARHEKAALGASLLNINKVECECGHIVEITEEAARQCGYVYECTEWNCGRCYCLLCKPLPVKRCDSMAGILDHPHVCVGQSLFNLIADCLTFGEFPHCPICLAAGETPILDKDPSCNVLRCPTCKQNFCWLCLLQLSSNGETAHNQFNPGMHHNQAADCSLFDPPPQAHFDNRRRINVANLLRSKGVTTLTDAKLADSLAMLTSIGFTVQHFGLR